MNNPWKRIGFFYVSRMDLYKGNQKVGIVIRQLSYFTYHLIRLWHGEKKMIEMTQNAGAAAKLGLQVKSYE